MGNREREPETTGVVLDMVADGLVAPAWTRGRSLVEVLSARWDRIWPLPRPALSAPVMGRIRPSQEPATAFSATHRKPLEAADTPRRVPPTHVAEWAGHSVEVLLKVYAKCLDGQDALARRRVLDALGYADRTGRESLFAYEVMTLTEPCYPMGGAARLVARCAAVEAGPGCHGSGFVEC